MDELPAVDRTGGPESPSSSSTPRVDVRVVLFTVRGGRLLIAL